MNKGRTATSLAGLSAAGRQAAVRKNWAEVNRCAQALKRLRPREPEGHFLQGLAHKGRGHIDAAEAAFAKALELDGGRYDAAIELAFVRVLLNRHAEARSLLDGYREHLGNSPVYLDLAGQAYTLMSLHTDAWEVFELADRLQPNIDRIQANLAACAVNVGKIGTAREVSRRLLAKNPAHQRNHYELSKLQTVSDDAHVRQMKAILETADPDPARVPARRRASYRRSRGRT